MTPNIWFKRIRTAQHLTRRDVVEIMRLAGENVTSSQADGWMRREDDDRAVIMTVEQFDRFTNGLAHWMKSCREGGGLLARKTGEHNKSGGADWGQIRPKNSEINANKQYNDTRKFKNLHAGIMLREQGVGGSNPLTPTNKTKGFC